MQRVVNCVLSMKKMSNCNGIFSYKTDIGKVRKTNEDEALVLTNATGDIMLVVCDGMGGHVKGDVAARIAIDTMKNEFKNKVSFTNANDVKRFLSRATKKANDIIFQSAKENDLSKRMGTTMTVVIIRKNNLFVLNIGDSRAYLIDDNTIEQVTEDDSYVNYLYHLGKITLEEMDVHPKRHILMNALGLFQNANFEINVIHYDGCKVFLCTDGLYTMLSEEEMLSIITTSDSVDDKCDMLVKNANRNGGLDNIAVALWEVEK